MRFETVRTLSVWGKEQDCRITGNWTPSRPPPVCHDHDDPKFSDDGNPGEIEVEQVRDENGRLIPEDVWEGLIDLNDLYCDVAERAESEAQAAAEDHADAEYERRHEMGWD